jgi:hypothetical protein
MTAGELGMAVPLQINADIPRSKPDWISGDAWILFERNVRLAKIHESAISGILDQQRYRRQATGNVQRNSPHPNGLGTLSSVLENLHAVFIASSYGHAKQADEFCLSLHTRL